MKCRVSAALLCMMLGVFAPSCQHKTETTRISAEQQRSSILTFKREGNEIGRSSLFELLERFPPVVVEGFDPYYQNVRRFRALPIEGILTKAYAADVASLRTHHWLLRAADGYTVPLSGERLLEGGACIAFEDLDKPSGWDPIGPQQANPGPFYLVWSKPTQTSLDTHPRPWQLASFDIVSFETAFPHTDPKVAKDDPAAHGYGIFKTYCIRCHAINREGGRVGPELNVPKSIVEYRPEEQIREYILNPATFRYGNMPAHLQLTKTDLDGLIAYFRVMQAHKHDPDAQKNGGAH
ncbi:MAG: cytochrome c [Polyangiaceae bacterium]|nr:cytochrome c [Polyangiaceae bacterium]